jgi:hypothetical protein
LSIIFDRIQQLVAKEDVYISEHGYDELAADDLMAQEVVEGFTEAELIEEYPDYPKGPCILVMQRDVAGKPIHAVWGVPKGHSRPAVLVTAYRPDPERWESDSLRRRR